MDGRTQYRRASTRQCLRKRFLIHGVRIDARLLQHSQSGLTRQDKEIGLTHNPIKDRFAQQVAKTLKRITADPESQFGTEKESPTGKLQTLTLFAIKKTPGRQSVQQSPGPARRVLELILCMQGEQQTSC